jgi:hypothetical protein
MPTPSRRRIVRVDRAIDRYRRDVALLTGRILPVSVNLDDLALLDFVTFSQTPDAIVADRKLRIKTLEAMRDMLREVDRAAAAGRD